MSEAERARLAEERRMWEAARASLARAQREIALVLAVAERVIAQRKEALNEHE